MASRNQFIAVYHHNRRCVLIMFITIILIIIIIITTRPRMESWGQDTIPAGTFWGILDVLPCAFGVQPGLNIVA